MRLALLLLALALPTLADTRLVRETEALSPTEEQSKLQVPDGFEIQLFASEPMINKPINLAFDARGRLWVSSTVEYPYSADKARWSDPQGTHVKDSRDAIKILEDTDGDGKADKVTDFADGLNIPTGVLPWHKPEHHAGCIAFSIPNIWYFADTNGDGKADLREILFGPLGYEKDTHGMCSSFRLGLDGWVYATHGFNNASTFKRKDGSTLELHSGNVFRFRPDGSDVQLWSAGQVNPFGLAWDRYNNLYSADCHSSPVYQLLRGAHYPSFGKPHEGLGFAPVMCQHTHGSTGICGIVYIDGGVWGPEWDDHLFLGNVVTSKINHDHVTFSGSTPKANEQPDFLTSDDPWFRPVDLTLGPDSALYIADFYNRIIGHYEIPLDHPGRDRERGRIWRVVKKDIPAPATDFTVMAQPKIAEELGSPNLTRRHLALRELQKRGDPSWLPSLLALIDGTENQTPLGDARPDRNYPPGDTVPHDAGTGFYFQKNDLQAATALWALAHLGERRLLYEMLRGQHTGGSWVEDDRDENGIALPSRQFGLIMSHATQVIGSYDRWHPWEKWALGIIFHMRGSATARAAASSLLHRPDFLADNPAWQGKQMASLVKLLDQLIEPDVPESNAPWQNAADTQLIQSLRILLRDFLSQPGVFNSTAWQERVPKILNAPWFMDLLHAVPAPDVSRFLAAHLSHPPQEGSLRQIARYGDLQTLQKLISSLSSGSLQSPLEATQTQQLLHHSFLERGLPPPPEFLAWAQATATSLLAKVAQNPEPTWSSIPTSSKPPLWTLHPRKRPDSGELPTLQSMAKGGGDEESRTGILRSKAFPAPQSLSFFICGHRGPPAQAPHDRNLVRLISATGGTVLRTAFPPRSDTLQLVSWELADLAGETVRLEIVDGDSCTAYAWLGITGIEPSLLDVQAFQQNQTTQQALSTLATLLRTTAPITLRDQLAPYLPPSPAPPPAPVSPEQRAALDQLIAARLASFQKAKPDPVIGATLFATHCAACHQIAGQGGLIGPQLDGIGSRGVARLCEDILDPNRNVDAHFRLHLITRKDGTTHTGFLKAEIGQVLILADATGTETRIPKADIITDQTLPHSLMPPTFGQTLSEPDLHHLLSHLLTR
jgi:putative heme-binding domain-containing protein